MREGGREGGSEGGRDKKTTKQPQCLYLSNDSCHEREEGKHGGHDEGQFPADGEGHDEARYEGGEVL